MNKINEPQIGKIYKVVFLESDRNTVYEIKNIKTIKESMPSPLQVDPVSGIQMMLSAAVYHVVKVYTLTNKFNNETSDFHEYYIEGFYEITDSEYDDESGFFKVKDFLEHHKDKEVYYINYRKDYTSIGIILDARYSVKLKKILYKILDLDAVERHIVVEYEDNIEFIDL